MNGKKGIYLFYWGSAPNPEVYRHGKTSKMWLQQKA